MSTPDIELLVLVAAMLLSNFFARKVLEYFMRIGKANKFADHKVKAVKVPMWLGLMGPITALFINWLGRDFAKAQPYFFAAAMLVCALSFASSTWIVSYTRRHDKYPSSGLFFKRGRRNNMT